jgi:beta-lactamase superfamily II metal-dependent hydrolase
MTVTLDVLPAGHGDALVVTYGPPSRRRRILIDGGPAPKYEEGLRAHVLSLPESQRRFDLAIVTHIDADHIDGMLKLLQDRALGLKVRELWFNGWPQISGSPIPAPTRPGDRGPLQGEFLTALLSTRRWNTTFGGGVAGQHLDRRIPLPGGATLSVLCPTDAELARLRRAWDKTVTEAGFAPGDSAAVARRLAESGRYAPPEEAVRTRGGPPVRERPRFGSDRAVANGSSIAVVLEAEGRRLLLAGDAHARVMVDALRKTAARDGTERVKVDVFKLAHHGSAGNVSRELLDLVECDRFVVSTNGQYFDHPDVEAIELLGRRGDARRPTVYFNYESETTRAWTDRAECERIGIQAVYGQDGHLTVQV